MVQGVTAWLTQADILVPVWSGASKATFTELANEVNFNLSIVKAVRAPNRIAKGRSAGQGDLKIDARNAIGEATYSTTLDHLVFNEFNNANAGGDPKVFSRLKNPGPYNFLEQANAAFEAATDDFQFPRPKFRITRVRF